MKPAITILLLFCFIFSFAQNKTIDEANQLIEDKKYEAAYNILNQADPSNKNPEIVLAKTDLFLKYFVSSIMHQLFALTDLEADEEILDIRGSEGNYSMFDYAPDSVLLNLIAKYPDNYKLKKQLGYYYHEVHLKYPGSWLIEDSVLVNKFQRNYLEAHNNGVFDYWSTYGIGYSYLVNQQYKNAIPYLKKSTELKDDYPSSHYNLAFAYLYTDQRVKGISSAITALELYDNPEFKADAARMIALMYEEIGDSRNALHYYMQADSYQANDYYTLKALLDLELSLNQESYRDRTGQFFLLAPTNPTIYQDLINIYASYNKEDELLAFLSAQHNSYSKNNTVNGNLYFYKAVVQYDKKDHQNAKTNFEKSRDLFQDVYEPNHRIFEAIDSYTSDLQ